MSKLDLLGGIELYAVLTGEEVYRACSSYRGGVYVVVKCEECFVVCESESLYSAFAAEFGLSSITVSVTFMTIDL